MFIDKLWQFLKHTKNFIKKFSFHKFLLNKLKGLKIKKLLNDLWIIQHKRNLFKQCYQNVVIRDFKRSCTGSISADKNSCFNFNLYIFFDRWSLPDAKKMVFHRSYCHEFFWNRYVGVFVFKDWRETRGYLSFLIIWLDIWHSWSNLLISLLLLGICFSGMQK